MEKLHLVFTFKNHDYSWFFVLLQICNEVVIYLNSKISKDKL